MTYKSSKNPPITEHEISEYAHKNEMGWFASDIFLTIGMIGTVMGFIYMLSTSFAEISTANVVTLKTAMSKMSMGMGAALYTTAAGLICGTILKIQQFDIQLYLDKIDSVCKCGGKK
jgi:hypothetical protein